MYKIAFAGKAGTGKNTAAYMLGQVWKSDDVVSLAFADPIKEIVKIMFPHVQHDHLYGPSKFRNEIIKGAFDSDGNPLTIRRALLDIGTKVGRSYNDSLWLEAMEYQINYAKSTYKKAVLVTDVRFRNEFDWLKKLGFFMVKVIRDDATPINHISETGQNEIKESEYDFVLDNNGSINQLSDTIKIEILPKISYV